MNFSLGSARKCALAAVLAAVCGCGPNDGSKELADAKAAYGLKDYAKAAKLLEKSMKAAGSNVEAALLLAQSRLATGEISLAQEALKRIEEAAGGDADFLLLAGQVAYQTKDYAKALRSFEQLAKDSGAAAKLKAEALCGIGVVQLTCNEYPAARVAFLKALRLDRTSASAHYHLGRLYRDGLGYPEAALESFEKFVYLGDAADARVKKVQRSFIPELKERITRELAALHGADKRSSAASAATLAKAEAEMKKGGKSVRTALKLYEQAAREDVLSYPAALGLAKAYLRADGSKAGLAKAYEAYKAACRLKANSLTTFLAAGDLAVRLGYSAQAVEIYSRALAADASSLVAAESLVRSLKRVGGRDNQAAAAIYQKYVETLPRKAKRK